MKRRKAERHTKEEKRLQIIRTACKLFSQKGYHHTTMPHIARALRMSVGNLYYYFESKEELAKEVMLTVSSWVAQRLRSVNQKDIPTKEKIREFTREFLLIAQEEPELIEYFLRVFMANREVFPEECSGFNCIQEVIQEITLLLTTGAQRGEIKDVDLLLGFTALMGPMGGLVFLRGEGLLERELPQYADDLTELLWSGFKR